VSALAVGVIGAMFDEPLLADESQFHVPAFERPHNAARECGDGRNPEDDPDESHAQVPWFEFFFAVTRDYWMRSVTAVRNKTRQSPYFPTFLPVELLESP
jgi:hypothetical protein